MGMSFRKSKNFGPIRVNVSKSGVGGSVGPKGARAGITSTGSTYVRGGSNGVYFHQNLRTINASNSQATIIEAIGEAAVYGTDQSYHITELINEFKKNYEVRDKLKRVAANYPVNSENRVSLQNYLNNWQEQVDEHQKGIQQLIQNTKNAALHAGQLLNDPNVYDPQYAVGILKSLISNNEFGDLLIEGFEVFATGIKKADAVYTN